MVTTRTARKSRRLKRLYGINLRQYNQILRAQRGGCGICDRKPAPNRALDVDHDHKTGEVRGLLCHSCNRGLHWYRDNPDLLLRAAEYLTNPPAKPVLHREEPLTS